MRGSLERSAEMKIIGYETKDGSIVKGGRVTYIIDDDLSEDAPVLAILDGPGYTPEQIEGIGEILMQKEVRP